MLVGPVPPLTADADERARQVPANACSGYGSKTENGTMVEAVEGQKALTYHCYVNSTTKTFPVQRMMRYLDQVQPISILLINCGFMYDVLTFRIVSVSHPYAAGPVSRLHRWVQQHQTKEAGSPLPKHFGRRALRLWCLARCAPVLL
eukprot:COSAG01_NODE_19780_length_989_cov_5.232584_1_plen_147_part_00